MAEVVPVGEHDMLLGRLQATLEALQQDICELRKDVRALKASRALMPAWLERTLTVIGALVSGYFGGKVGGQ